MKNLIRRGLKNGGKTIEQLNKRLLIDNIFTEAFLEMRLNQMIQDGEVIECYGGYYMLNN